MTVQQEAKKSRLSPALVRLLWTAGLATFGVLVWPIGDLAYRHEFATPGFWWLLVLVALAAWISVIFVLGQDRIIDGQGRILDRLDDLEAKDVALEDRIAAYGDERESDGHVAALRVHNGHGPVGHLTLVD